MAWMPMNSVATADSSTATSTSARLLLADARWTIETRHRARRRSRGPTVSISAM